MAHVCKIKGHPIFWAIACTTYFSTLLTFATMELAPILFIDETEGLSVATQMPKPTKYLRGRRAHETIVRLDGENADGENIYFRSVSDAARFIDENCFPTNKKTLCSSLKKKNGSILLHGVKVSLFGMHHSEPDPEADAKRKKKRMKKWARKRQIKTVPPKRPPTPDFSFQPSADGAAPLDVLSHAAGMCTPIRHAMPI